MGEPLQPIAIGRGNIATEESVQLYWDNFNYYYLPSNSRLQANLTEATSVNLPPQPNDGARVAVVDNSGNLATNNLTLVGNGRLIEGGTSVVLSTNNLQREWFYREDTGTWNRLSALELDSESPFPIEFDDILILGLAMRINPRQGVTMDPQSQSYMMDIRRIFRARYAQHTEVPSELALIRTTGNRYAQDGVYSTREFQRGLPLWY
jgi:hypothetical protein